MATALNNIFTLFDIYDIINLSTKTENNNGKYDYHPRYRKYPKTQICRIKQSDSQDLEIKRIFGVET